MTTTGQKHAKVKELAKRISTGIYEMLRLVDEILNDHEYLDSQGGEAAFMDSLAADEFCHFGGSPTVDQLIRAYRANPKRATWEEYRYNVWAMIDLATPAKDAAAVQRVNWKARCVELEAEVEKLKQYMADLRTINDQLRLKVDEQSERIGEYRGQLKMLRRAEYVQ